MNVDPVAQWQGNPNLVNEWREFWQSKAGLEGIKVLRRKFRPNSDETPVVPGVPYTEVFAFRGCAYEAFERMFDAIEKMAVPRPTKPEPKEPTPGFHSQLLREPEKESPQKPAKPQTRKRK